ncbi:MAG: hypothetical protein PHO91_04515, partial [Patescibacteria group bacterium]|nr:hypothetical protein [Patescibacteria group bacterium]
MVREAKKNNFYAKIVAFFFILTLIAIFFVVNLALARVTIKLESQNKKKSDNILVQLKPESTTD